MMFSTPVPEHFRPELAALIFTQLNADDIPPGNPEETELSDEDLGNVAGGKKQPAPPGSPTPPLPPGPPHIPTTH
jgi:hypothetical protein